MDLSYYQRCTYKDGGRGNGFYDCWGLVREVLHKDFGYPLFASFGSFGSVSSTDKAAFTQGFSELSGEFVEIARAEEAAVMLSFQSGVLQHVGICIRHDGFLKVLHAHLNHGVRLDKLRNFPRFCDGNEIKILKVAA